MADAEFIVDLAKRGSRLASTPTTPSQDVNELIFTQLSIANLSNTIRART